MSCFTKKSHKSLQAIKKKPQNIVHKIIRQVYNVLSCVLVSGKMHELMTGTEVYCYLGASNTCCGPMGGEGRPFTLFSIYPGKRDLLSYPNKDSFKVSFKTPLPFCTLRVCRIHTHSQNLVHSH